MSINLFHTIIDSSTYNLDINGSCTVTVTLLDYNNNPIPGKSISISCTDGLLNDLDNTYTNLTDSNGQIQATYKPSNWGLHHLICNDKSIGVWITGKKLWKGNEPDGVTITTAYLVRYSRTIAQFEVTNATLKGTSGKMTTVATISKDHIRPYSKATTIPSAGFVYLSNYGDADLSISSDGNIQWRCAGTSSGASNCQAGVCYTRKTPYVGE